MHTAASKLPKSHTTTYSGRFGFYVNNALHTRCLSILGVAVIEPESGGSPHPVFLGQSNRNWHDLLRDLHYCADPCSIQPIAVTLTGLETTRRLNIPVSSSSR